MAATFQIIKHQLSSVLFIHYPIMHDDYNKRVFLARGRRLIGGEDGTLLWINGSHS